MWILIEKEGTKTSYLNYNVQICTTGMLGIFSHAQLYSNSCWFLIYIPAIMISPFLRKTTCAICCSLGQRMIFGEDFN